VAVTLAVLGVVGLAPTSAGAPRTGASTTAALRARAGASPTSAAASGHVGPSRSARLGPPTPPALTPGAPRRVMLVLLAAGGPPLLDLLGADPGIAALGLLNPAEGDYNEEQALLDVTQGARASHGIYQPPDAPAIDLHRTGSTAEVEGWPGILARAARAPATLRPGLLAGAVPGGGAYVTAAADVGRNAVLAADRAGRVALASTGSADTLPARVSSAASTRRLVVVDAPPAPDGVRLLDALLGRRRPQDLILAVQSPPPTFPGDYFGPPLLALGATGLPGGRGGLTSPTTRRFGLVTATDLAPTILHALGVAVGSGVAGQPMRVRGPRSALQLRVLGDRLRVLGGRRFETILVFLLVWLGVVLAGGLVAGRAGVRSALRMGGLAALWTPATVLLAAALRPGRVEEMAIVVGGAFVAGAVSDRLLRWPRGPIAPAVVVLVAYTVDLARGSPLTVQSLLGPNPLFGSRFYGIGNELLAALPVVLFAGLAAGLPQRPAHRRDLIAFAVAGAVLTGVLASGRLGAKVGAVFAIGGGSTAGALMLIPRGASRRSLAWVVALPLIALVVLAGVDALTGAGSHFTRTIVDAGGTADVLTTLRRKLEEAYNVLMRDIYPLNTVVALLAIALAVRRRHRLLAPVAASALWRACFVGGAAGSVIGSLTDDSGPLLVIVGTFGLACVAAYLRGDPRPVP